MVDRIWHQRTDDMLNRAWRWYLMLVMLLLINGLFMGGTGATEHGRAVQIGVLTESWGLPASAVGLRDGLLALGYREHLDFVIGTRFTQGDLTALPAAAEDLVRYGSDLLFVTQPDSAKAAQRATSQIPIVFTSVGDPIGLGLIQSFARPGGNITGVTTLHYELSPKRLEVFREIIPTLKQVLYLYDASDTYAVEEAKIYQNAAHQLGIKLVEQAVRSETEAQATLAQLSKDTVDGILAPTHVSLNIWGLIVEATSQRRLPSMFDGNFMVERGAFASYGANSYEAGKQAARLVDKILKGAKPAEIPVEVDSKVELTINLKTAKTLGITIPPELLYRADRLIR